MTPTDTVVSEERLREHKPWPLLGYAPGSYSCLCSICSREFIGDKRASMCLECAAQGARELLDRRTATPQSGGVVVEGLEWEHIEDSDLRGGETFIAVTVFGKYQVWGDGVWSDPHNFHDPVPGFPAGYWNATTGKAAASAHYEARILSTLADPIPEAPADEEVEGTATYGWHCNNCRRAFTSKQDQRLGNGDRNGGPNCPHCKAGGQYTYRCELHEGDPCRKCGVSNDDVTPGECRSRSTETDKPGVREQKLLSRIANALFANREGTQAQHEHAAAIQREVEPLLMALGMEDVGDGWGFSDDSPALSVSPLTREDSPNV